MRGNLPACEFKNAGNLPATLKLLRDEPGIWRPFAGGTDLMVLLEAGVLTHGKFVNLSNLPELHGITVTDSSVTIGALTSYSEISRHPVLAAEFSLLGIAARETGAIAIQNRGTLGGNIANASPAADTPPALLVYDTEIELVSSSGARKLPYSEFHLGYKKTALRSDELIHRIHLKRDSRPWASHYRKVGTRKAQAISKACFAGRALVQEGRLAEVRLAFGSVGPTPLRCPRTEALLTGKTLEASLIHAAAAELPKDISPIADIRSTAEYRLQVAGNLLQEFLGRL